MAKSKVLCAHCDAKVTKAHAFCPNCKNPTVFATVEQRTAWELEQWTSKRTSPRKVVAAAVKPKRASAMVEQPAAPTPLAPPKPEPIKRVPTRRTIHPTVAAHGNDHASNGNGHATNGNGTAAHGTNEQTEILRELLRRVVAIEEKMTVPAPRARRFRLRKG